MPTPTPPPTQYPFQIERVSWQQAETDLRIIREFIFIREQNVPPELEWDGKDEHCMHMLARDKQGRAIGTARMTPDGHIGRMAVLRAWRSRGVGSSLLKALLTVATARQLPRVQLDAQIQAMDFYLRHGFKPQGETFMDAGIEHQHMTRQIASLDEHLNIRGLREQILGETRGIIRLTSRDDNRETAVRMVEQGDRTLRLFTPNLDPRLFDTEPFIEAVKKLALDNPRSKVYVLILDPSIAVSRGHRIVELARRMSSHVFIHRADEEDKDRIDSFMVVDDMGLIHRAHNDRFEGVAEFNNPSEARRLVKEFTDVWERSRPEPELRRLHI
ncbi:MAG: GNAT family N-acetyltransferase [Gammaproteobacteria bacterium]|nr:GNAT family N-acetyltransferase [Gammaproteobacteria bacterium]